ncbi:DOPA 4,5-dioxygenase family protein [Colwellia sp. RE-S-Sl-9]
MNLIKRPVNSHNAYHAHIYFEQETLSFATDLCEKAGEYFNLKVGRIHQQPVGPHPKWSCQISFSKKHFDEFVAWLEFNRKDLTVFIHPLSGNDLDDHTLYAYWLGDSVKLNTSMFEG